MALKVRESFRVGVPPARVWEFLIDPAQVVQCLPGAELTEMQDGRSYRGRVKVKVGPISTMYEGTATLTEVDDHAHRMQMVGEGRESGGAGTARMTMVGVVVADPAGGSRIDVDATIDIAGRVMQFGGGLIESVSRQLFRQFADAARATLERREAASKGVESEAPPPQAPAAVPPRELQVIPLLFRAIADWLRRLFRRSR
jgi:carbon monoxide dehydrogenase subunit G